MPITKEDSDQSLVLITCDSSVGQEVETNRGSASRSTAKGPPSEDAKGFCCERRTGRPPERLLRSPLLARHLTSTCSTINEETDSPADPEDKRTEEKAPMSKEEVDKCKKKLLRSPLIARHLKSTRKVMRPLQIIYKEADRPPYPEELHDESTTSTTINDGWTVVKSCCARR